MYLADRKTAALSPATLLARVAERFEHQNPNSLKHYLNDVIRRYSASRPHSTLTGTLVALPGLLKDSPH